MAAWACYWLEPAGTVALGLRRYTPLAARQPGPVSWTCAAGWHQGFAWRDITCPARWATTDGRRHQAAALPVSHADPDWPAACDQGCGYAFGDGDAWQEWEEALYRRAGQPARLEVLHAGWPPPPRTVTAMPGAMWDAWWLPDDWRGPDGIALMVRVPAPGAQVPHDWIVDGPATGGGRWTRTGNPKDPPTLTVTPSIAAGHPDQPGYWHGFLTAGQLA